MGKVVEERDPVLISEAIKKVWSNIENYKPQYLNKIITNSFGEKAFTNKILGIYDDVLKKYNA